MGEMIAEVGIVVEPEKSGIMGSLLAKAIVAKLLTEYQAVKDILYKKRPHFQFSQQQKTRSSST